MDPQSPPPESRYLVDSNASSDTVPNPKAWRYSGQALVSEVRSFADRLKARALWIKQFLHER